MCAELADARFLERHYETYLAILFHFRVFPKMGRHTGSTNR